MIRIKQNPQEGVLNSKGKIVYEYSFNEGGCKYRGVMDDGSFTKWLKPEYMMIEMRD